MAGSAKNVKGSETVKGSGGTERTADSGQGNTFFHHFVNYISALETRSLGNFSFETIFLMFQSSSVSASMCAEVGGDVKLWQSIPLTLCS